MLCLRNVVFCALFFTLVIDQSFTAPSGTAPAHHSIRDLRSLEPRSINAEHEGGITIKYNEKTSDEDEVHAEFSSFNHDNEKRNVDSETERKEENSAHNKDDHEMKKRHQQEKLSNKVGTLEQEDHTVTEKSVEKNEEKSVEGKSTESHGQVEEQAGEAGRESKSAERMRKRSKSVGTGNKAVVKRAIEGYTAIADSATDPTLPP